MKNTFLLLLLISAVATNAQSLKDALFSGKLKNQPGTVIRKGDDLTAKMDTAYKVPAADTGKANITAVTPEPVKKSPAPQTDPGNANVAPVNKPNDQTNAAIQTDTTTTETTEAVTTDTPKEAAKPKDNNGIWKDYIKTLSETLKAEVLSSKKVKKGDYYILVSYAIETDGKVTVTDVFVDPGNDFLQQQIKDRLSLEAPQLNPVLNSAGTPRKVNKKYNFTLTKE